jgi:hypothetical protein
MSQKMLMSLIILGLITVSLSLVNGSKSIAQNDYQDFLDQVYNLSLNNCQSQGSACSNCAESLTRNIIEHYKITDRRMQQDIYNAALDACD